MQPAAKLVELCLLSQYLAIIGDRGLQTVSASHIGGCDRSGASRMSLGAAQLRPSSSLSGSAPGQHARLGGARPLPQKRRSARLVPRTAEPAAPAQPADTRSAAELVDFVLAKIEGTGEQRTLVLRAAKHSWFSSLFGSTGRQQRPRRRLPCPLPCPSPLRRLPPVLAPLCCRLRRWHADGGDQIAPADRQAVDAALQRLDDIGEAKVG